MVHPRGVAAAAARAAMAAARTSAIDGRHVLRADAGRTLMRARNALVPNGACEVLSCKTPGQMLWYSCGPTVYADAHLGHARAYVSFDVIRRIIESLSQTKVVLALGVTDVDDKIIAAASKSGESPALIARRYEKRFFEDLSALRVLPPTYVLRVTEHIPELVGYISRLIESDRAYRTESGHVYFRVASAGSRYGQLDPSRVKGEDANLEDDPDCAPIGEKEDKRDFALWKGGDSGEGATWDSPWGRGRPGWHIECAAMATSALGNVLDMHTGGIDLRFPHHTNELALAEGAGCVCDHSGRWVHTWLHAGHMHIQGCKMSKSKKNFVKIREFLEEGGDPDAFRMFVLLHRYSAPVEYAPDGIAYAASTLTRLRRFVRHAQPLMHCVNMHPRCSSAEKLLQSARLARSNVNDALADDFDTPRAINVLTALAHSGNIAAREDPFSTSGALRLAQVDAAYVIAGTLSMLGISGFDAMTDEKRLGGKDNSIRVIDALVRFRSKARLAARSGDTKAVLMACDEARASLKREFGINVEDQADGGSTWDVNEIAFGESGGKDSADNTEDISDANELDTCESTEEQSRTERRSDSFSSSEVQIIEDATKRAGED